MFRPSILFWLEEGRVNIKYLLGETEPKIRFVLPEKLILDEARLSLTSLNPKKLMNYNIHAQSRVSYSVTCSFMQITVVSL